jgi:N-acetylneuraminate epimerase
MKPACFLLLIMTMITSLIGCETEEKGTQIEWRNLPAIPDSIGFAGSFAAVIQDKLLLAGGANFPDGGFPWTGSVKRWTDKVFILNDPNGEWKAAGQLPVSLGYGASVTWNNETILIGGSNEAGHSSAVIRISMKDSALVYDSLPDLPYPLANTAAVLHNGKIFVTGGLKTPDAKEAVAEGWTLDMNNIADGWKALPEMPEARMLHVMGVDSSGIYVFSGTKLVEGKREYLKDAYHFDEKKGWQKLADLPSSVTAAPGPAVYENGSFYIFGGDDGKLASKSAELKDQHPGFSTTILCYSVKENKWSEAEKIKTIKEADAIANPNGSIWAPVTTAAVLWKGMVVIPGGEVRPATRTNRVIAAQIR